MKRFAAMLLIICMMFSGCGWLRGSYVSITRHEDTGSDRNEGVVSVSNYEGLCRALEAMVREGRENNVIHVANYVRAMLETDMENAMTYIREEYPFGAYAVEIISCELGTSGAVPAIAVEIVYRHSGSELRKIRAVRDMETVGVQVGLAMERFDSELVLLVGEYADSDLQQVVEDYAADHPDTIMETPRIARETYPQKGSVRVLEIRFSYQNSRDDLRQMQEQTAPVFASAALYVSGNDSELTQYTQLYAFLKERFTDYQIKTSITPSYSLLRHGVGDSKAFATVYARMCRRAGLECRVVAGTRDAEAWVWNMVCCDGNYFHVDLLDMEGPGGIRLRTDAQMENYVWDYSAYPACEVEEPVLEEEATPPATQIPTAAPTQPATEPSVPETTPVPEPTQVPETTETVSTEAPTVPSETEADTKKQEK